MRISCTNSFIHIVNVSLDEARVPCKETKCVLDDKDIKAINTTCNGRNECVLGTKWSTSCIREYGYFNVSYICNGIYNNINLVLLCNSRFMMLLLLFGCFDFINNIKGIVKHLQTFQSANAILFF